MHACEHSSQDYMTTGIPPAPRGLIQMEVRAAVLAAPRLLWALPTAWVTSGVGDVCLTRKEALLALCCATLCCADPLLCCVVLGRAVLCLR
jgi:hypothetical protein